jgi:hypothetical protein
LTGSPLASRKTTALNGPVGVSITSTTRFPDAEAIGAATSAPRVCALGLATKSLTQMLKRGKDARNGKLRSTFFTIQPGKVRLKATATVGGKTVTIGRATRTSGTYGVDIATLNLTSTAAKALRKAKTADIKITATGAQGAPFTQTFTLKR